MGVLPTAVSTSRTPTSVSRVTTSRPRSSTPTPSAGTSSAVTLLSTWRLSPTTMRRGTRASSPATLRTRLRPTVLRSFTARLTARSVRTHSRRTRRPAPRRARRSGGREQEVPHSQEDQGAEGGHSPEEDQGACRRGLSSLLQFLWHGLTLGTVDVALLMDAVVLHVVAQVMLLQQPKICDTHFT